MKKNKETRNRSEKNVTLLLILFGVILLTLGSSNIYKNRLQNKIDNSYISKYITSVQFNEVKNAILEFSPDTFLYISYTGNPDIHNLEVKTRKILRDNELIDNMIYMNINDLIDEKDYIDLINKTLELDKTKINKFPAIVYYKNNKVVELIDSTGGIIDSSKFSSLLEKYELLK